MGDSSANFLPMKCLIQSLMQIVVQVIQVEITGQVNFFDVNF